ncbi:uroporphyrinogen decarboxylase family protein [Ignisphaera sp. 4213-co]|uniref:Uroporphyrinogen decarboxylase family protein n=1 Tax=Ignisphaera cupida TaxID=3050454 RepID=A0ABD4Z787_9CREN|nr:uroporphyrinogen decarboxylase family protein [Ignisphaera sp. 4213-co]MDK6028783.1 uroporphyrinogen decarboxylase family protein [Ignisphaera sp. 4213-co]
MAMEPIDEWIKRHEKEPEEVAKEKLNRFLKAVELKVPDRVPIAGAAGDFLCSYTGITWYELSYSLTDKVENAVLKFVHDFPSDWPILLVPMMLEGFALALAFAEFPDFSNIIRFLTGPLHDVLKDKWSKWPGRELRDNMHPQFLGGEFMKPEEYKQLIDNPVEFMNQVILPRVCEGLGKPGSSKWNGAWIRAGIAMQKVIAFQINLFTAIAKAGYPIIPLGTNAYAPADVIGDFLRHPTGAMLDIRRYPDNFKAACEALVDPILKVATAVPPTPPVPLFFIPLHLNEMLPPKLYNEFYWPYLKRIIETLVSKGYKGFVIFEGDHSPHVDTLLELPKGWGIGWFERPKDFIKIWEKLKGHTIVMGGVPTTLLASGTPQQIDEYVKNLLNKIKPEGGFIISPSIGELPAGTPPENVRAYINAALKYGTY